MKTLLHINSAMEILAHRIAHNPNSVIGSSDYEVYKLLRDALPAIEALIELHGDSECYCPENLAVKSVCPFCKAKDLMAVVKVGYKGNTLVDYFTKIISDSKIP